MRHLWTYAAGIGQGLLTVLAVRFVTRTEWKNAMANMVSKTQYDTEMAALTAKFTTMATAVGALVTGYQTLTAELANMEVNTEEDDSPLTDLAARLDALNGQLAAVAPAPAAPPASTVVTSPAPPPDPNATT